MCYIENIFISYLYHAPTFGLGADIPYLYNVYIIFIASIHHIYIIFIASLYQFAQYIGTVFKAYLYHSYIYIIFISRSHFWFGRRFSIFITYLYHIYTIFTPYLYNFIAYLYHMYIIFISDLSHLDQRPHGH